MGPAILHGIAEASDLIVAKWFPDTLTWKRLSKNKNNGQNTNLRRSTRKNRGKYSHQNQNKRLKIKYNLRDGDLLAFVDAKTLGSVKVEKIEWKREEDKLAEQYKILANIGKNKKGKNGSGGSVKKTNNGKRSAPVGDAKIHVYLGFSSEEEEEEEDKEGEESKD